MNLEYNTCSHFSHSQHRLHYIFIISHNKNFQRKKKQKKTQQRHMDLNGFRNIGARLPPGFRFYPSDEELVCHYLSKKIENHNLFKSTLLEIDLHTCEPWQLPEMAKLNADEWYFFSFRDRKYATGFRTNRATTCGYWKATGKDRAVVGPTSGEVVGMRKTLVFYKNRAPNGIKTGWIMHEFRLETPHMPPKEDWVLCRVFNKGKGAEEICYRSAQLVGPQYDIVEAHDSTPNNPPSSKSIVIDHGFPCGYHHQSTPIQQGHDHNSNDAQTQLLDTRQISSNLETLPQFLYKGNKEINNNIIDFEIDSHGFLLGSIDFEEHGLSTNLKGYDLRPDMDHTNMVFS